MTIINHEIAEIWRKEKMAWDSKDIERILDARIGSRGYGYRTSAWREYPPKSVDNIRGAIERYYEDLEYLRHVDIDLNTWSEGDVGIAWGSFTEEFKHKGQSAEETRVRFSSPYVRNEGKWRLLMSQNDIQPFTEEGRYPKELSQKK
jgi:hypothetical protein